MKLFFYLTIKSLISPSSCFALCQRHEYIAADAFPLRQAQSFLRNKYGKLLKDQEDLPSSGISTLR